MPVKIPGKTPDGRVQQILRDPKRYFTEARERARAEVMAERGRAGSSVPRLRSR